MPLKPKTFQRRGTGDLKEAITDILERRDAEALKKYVEVRKEAWNPFEIAKLVAAITLGITFFVMLFNTIFPGNPANYQIENTPIVNMDVSLNLIGTMKGTWKPTSRNLMKRVTPTLHEITVNLKKPITYYFTITNMEKNPLYTFGSSVNGTLIPIGETVDIHNGPETRKIGFQVKEPGKYLVRLQIVDATKFLVLILKA